MSVALSCSREFSLDRERFSKYVIAQRHERFGFDPLHEGGFAAAILARFYDAVEAAAILGPAEMEVTMYAPTSDSLIVAVRERTLPSGVAWPLRQLATFSFDTKEVAHFGDESFAECCAGIEELLARASALLPSFEALRAAESARAA